MIEMEITGRVITGKGERERGGKGTENKYCLLYTSDAADDWLVV